MQQVGIKFYTHAIFFTFNHVPFVFSEQGERGDPKEQLHELVRHKIDECVLSKANYSRYKDSIGS